MNNFSRNRLLTCFGETKTLSQWCDFKKIKRGCLESRLKNGWTIAEALTTPVIQGQKFKSISSRLLIFKGEEKTLQQWALLVGISRQTINNRLKNKWSVEEALTRPPNLANRYLRN